MSLPRHLDRVLLDRAVERALAAGPTPDVGVIVERSLRLLAADAGPAADPDLLRGAVLRALRSRALAECRREELHELDGACGVPPKRSPS